MRPPKINSNTRVVIVGAAGRLGKLMAYEFGKFSQVIGLTRHELDLADAKSIHAALGSLQYDYMVIPGALTGVDYCEMHQEEAFAINGEGPRLLAEISASKGAHVTYISTDMVFDGAKEGLYSEEDPVAPISVYGASKLQGEEGVLAASANNLVARVSWLYGPGKPAFPEWIIGEALKKRDLTLPGNKICCPSLSVDLIEFLRVLIFESSARPARGVFHLCNSNPCTWRDWGQACIDIAREAGAPILAEQIAAVDVASVAAFVAKRPLNSSMATDKLTHTTGITPRDWKIALREHLLQNSSLSNSPTEIR